MRERVWSREAAEAMGPIDLEEAGWFRPQYGDWFNGHHVGFHGGPWHGRVEYCEAPLHDLYRVTVIPEGSMLAVTEDMLDQPAMVRCEYHLYAIALYVRGGKPVRYLPILMDDEVVWEEWPNPNYQEQWRYIHQE